MTDEDARFALQLAMDGQRWMLFRWGSDYGRKYQRADGTNPIRDKQEAEIRANIQRLERLAESLGMSFEPPK